MGKRDFLRLVRDVGLIATGAAANKGINHIVGNQEHSDVETAQSVTYSPASTELLAQYREVDQENITQAKKMIQEINTNETSPLFYLAFVEEFIRLNTYEQIVELIENTEVSGQSMYDIILQLVPLAAQYKLVDDLVNDPQNDIQYKSARQKALYYFSRLTQIPLTNRIMVDSSGSVNPNVMGLAVKYYFDEATIMSYMDKANQGDRKLNNGAQAGLMQFSQPPSAILA